MTVMAKTVYIETTIPGAYYDDRDNLVSRFQRQQTRLWWRVHRSRYELVTSESVIVELTEPGFARSAECLGLLKDIHVLTVDDEVRGTAEVYVRNLVMPRGHVGDSLHLAFASVHQVDYLLTWNCQHLANPSKVTHITTINRRLGLLTPIILTPQMLVEETTDEA